MKKVISLLLVIVMLFTMVPASVFAADSTSVKLVSFMRGDVEDLRSSELLEVRVEGYEGNPRELTYKWTSSLGTYLYVYNSHNMYGINNTSGEIEIHNTGKNLQRLSNVPVERGFDKTFSGVGFAWASVYGAYSKSSALSGTVTVEVFDKNGKSLGSDSFSSFEAHNLDADLDNVVIGLFEGDKKNVLDLLGESGVVHITCTASKVSSASFKYGNEYVKVTQESTDVDKNGVLDYYIEGINAGSNSTSEGDAKLNITIKKGNCKFHKDKSGTAEPVVFVFKKPKTSTTTTTLTLIDDIDDRCEYFIDGNKGEKQPDGTIIFTGLTPNTNYTVEVRAEYKDGDETKYVYGYVDDTTKPVYRATVKTYLDGVITDISAIHGDDVTLYLHEDNATADYIELIRSGVGTYTAAVENGIYYPWHIEAGDHYHQARDYKIIIENANGELNLHHYSVAYDTNGGAFKSGEEVAKENFASSAAVNATNNVPVREGYIFTGWEYDGKIISSGAQITPHIVSPITLKARWEKAVNVTINVTINHQADGGYDHNEKREELTVEFLEKTADSPAFVETGDKLFFTQDIVKDEKGNSKPYKYSLEEEHLSIYTATDYTYTALLESSTFGVALSKSGYDVGAIEKKQDKLGNWVINIPLKYNPDDFDLEFSVEMDKDVPKELYPDAVIIKIACWDTENNTWTIISQQRTTDTVVKPGVRVDIDPETGEGKGSYPVWKQDANNNSYGYRAVVAGFIYKDSVVVVPTEKDHVKDENTVIITYTDGNYTATMGDIADGKKYSTSLNGAYYNDKTDAQQGTLDGVITVEKYNVTFDAKGGKVNGKDKDVAENQYYIPSFSGYQPTMNEHNFLGWYTDEECTIPATEGELLTEDITLYAKWDRILTGTLIVDGYYKDDEGQHIVYEKDRAKYALVELKEITNDGTYNIAGQTVEIDWTTDEHFSNPVEYKFTGLDPDKTYRIAVYLVNYEDAYQNSTTAKDSDDDIHNDYNETDYEAVYPANAYETYVNTFLHFVPEVYFQNVEVDATAVGEGFRPTNALVKYLAKEVGAADYSVIVQHNSAPYGVQVGMTAGGVNDGIYGCEVWKKVFNGNLYDYQANLTKLDGKALADWPVIVLYGDSVRWSPYNQAPTDALKVVIIPRHYQIVFNWNDGSSYKEIGSDYHIWSYESTVDGPEPVRKGYTFKGWYSNPECTGDAVTTIAADVATDTELYAKWEKNSYGYTVNYLEKGTGKVLTESKNATANYGDSVTETAVEIKGYTLADDNSKTIVIDTENNVINFYYTVGSYGYTVNYLEKGTGKVLTESKNATANYGDSVTETALEIKGYTLADDSSKSIVIDTENNVINFYYIVGNYGYTVNYLEKGTGKVLTESKNATANYGDSVTETALEIKGYTLADDSSKSIVIDTENNVINFYYIVGSYGYTVNYLEKGTGKVLAESKNATTNYGDSVTETAVEIKGYILADDNSKTMVIDTENNVINFYYTVGSYGYTVNYLEKGTGKVLAEPKNATANYGDSVTETAVEIKGYTLADDNSKTIVIDTKNSVINFYYTVNSYGYTVNYLEEGTNNVLSAAKTGDAAFGEAVTETAIAIDGYALITSAKQTITIAEEGNVINFYYTADKIGGGNGDSSDGIPDKYQKKVIFRVVNGTWEDGTTENIVKILALMKGDTYAIDGTAKLDAPKNMKPDAGYGNGEWSVTPPATVKGTNTVTYTYTFEKKAFNYEIGGSDVITMYEEETVQSEIKLIPDIGIDPDKLPTVVKYESADESIATVDQNGKITGVKKGRTTVTATLSDGNTYTIVVIVKERENITVVFGKTEGIGWYRVSQDGGATYQTVFGNSTIEVKKGTQLIIKAGDLMGDAFTFYVNGNAVTPDENNSTVVTVDGYMLIGALGIPVIVPDVEESLNWFQKIIKAIKDFFARLFGKK